MFESKRYSWDEIKNYGIVLKRSGITTNKWGAEYNVYFSDSENASKKASQRLLFVGIRLCITESDFERVECELRAFGGLYAKKAPYVSVNEE